MRSPVRRALSVAAIGVIALLVVPAHERSDTTRAVERHRAPHVTAITLSTTDAPSPAPRYGGVDLSFVGVFLTTAFAIAFAWRAMRRNSPYQRRDIRTLGYGRRRGPPFASA